MRRQARGSPSSVSSAQTSRPAGLPDRFFFFLPKYHSRDWRICGQLPGSARHGSDFGRNDGAEKGDWVVCGTLFSCTITGFLRNTTDADMDRGEHVRDRDRSLVIDGDLGGTVQQAGRQAG